MQKKILLVVAHPDDESLWFHAGIQALSSHASVDILCLTYNRQDNRGQELISAMSDFSVGVYFADLSDPGINNLLIGVHKALNSFLNEQMKSVDYNLIVTHPPHGGEKPHPHHIQAFFAVKAICEKHQIQFGFFSEKVYQVISEKSSQMRLNTILHRFFPSSFLSTSLISSIRGLGEIPLEDSCLHLLFKSALKDKRTLYLLTFSVNTNLKRRTLGHYQSQLVHLQFYKTLNSKKEFLYLEFSGAQSSGINPFELSPSLSSLSSMAREQGGPSWALEFASESMLIRGTPASQKTGLLSQQ